MKKFQFKNLTLIILSNLFLYLGITYAPKIEKKTGQILLPLSLDFKFDGMKKKIFLYDSFGEKISDNFLLIKEIGEGWFFTEVPFADLRKLTILKTDKFLASPFDKRVIPRESF